MRRRLSIVLLLVVLSGLAVADVVPPEPSAGCRPGTLPAVDGAEASLDGRRYWLDAPDAPADRPLPVVFVFHGFRDRAENLRRGTGFGTLARRDGFIAVFPDGHDGVRLLGTTGRGWDIGADDAVDRAFVGGLLDRLERERCVDRRRVFATGMSNGGFFSSLLGCQLADRFAAVAAVAGGMELGPCRPARPVPVLLLYGSNDAVVPPAMIRGARDWWVRANGCGDGTDTDGCRRYAGCKAPVVSCEGAQGHVWPSDAAERVWAFFTANPRVSP